MEEETCLLGRGHRVEACGHSCQQCGWNVEEARRRKAIPLTVQEDGTRRKILPPRENELGNKAGN